MGLFGTIRTAMGKGGSYVEEKIESEKRKIADRKDEQKAAERKRYDALLAKGVLPSVALKTIELEKRGGHEIVPTRRVERYQKTYPGRKETKVQRVTAPTKKRFMGVDWGKAASKISSNIQTNVARQSAVSLKQPDMGVTFKPPDFGWNFGQPAPRRTKREPEPTIKGYDMWGRPIYGKPKKAKGKRVVIYVR